MRACIGELVGAEAPQTEVESWLAGLGLGLVEIAAPDRFAWPGYFFGRSQGSWAVWFGVPPGVVFDPVGDADRGAPDSVLLLAPHELPSREDPPAGSGRVEAIAIAATATAPMVAVDSVRAIAGVGLEGDRYAARQGTFSDGPPHGRNITLVEAEALAGLFEDPRAARRNVVVGGVRLDGLLGRRFRIGAVECLGVRRCEPCAHLERLTWPGVLRGLVHRGGLRADLLSDGVIRVGDPVEALDQRDEL